MTHRLFFGIRPPEQVRDQLIDLMTGIDNARWQDDEQLHLTLRYVGEVDAHRADDLAEAASQLKFAPFDVRISGLGHFERKGVPSAVWAGVEPSDAVTSLHRKLERLCQTVGLEAETRKFIPHITLARLNSSSGPLAPFLTQNAGLSLGPWQVDSYILFESTLRTQGSLYEPVATYPSTS